MTRPFPLHAGIATVVARRALTPRMLRLTLAADAFGDPGIEQPGEIVTLGFAGPGEELVLPREGWRFPPGGPEQHWRNFTVRRSAPADATIDVDVFLHGPAGIAARWALNARPGDRVGHAGPRTHWEPVADAGWSLLAADETGLPALQAIVEQLPAGHRTIALVEVQDEAERAPVDSAADVDWHWCVRGDTAPGTSTVVIDTLRTLELPTTRGQCWGGGEALVMRDVRRHVAAHLPACAGAVQVLGYWKHRATPESVDYT
ncbi:hypothetical protein GKE82_17490 [Conexibacter sp. W3-3-2]|uniref:siderophore-interacting protein n=1 Tax=Conexibacter sp. W3-3-2 TaxID=2675227 RepID=UPI0012B75907|nr:siderophore-interacting protein [Conexibacter sp. W3-3-2]MTD46031.1 hypothetical protein [Conexibacter sp. W3-3-2]